MTNEAYEYFGCNEGDVVFIGVNSDTDDAGAIAWDNANGVHYTTISSTSGGTAISNNYGPAALPTLILIAPDQTIVEKDIWPIANATTITNLIEGYGPSQMACTTGDIKLPENTNESEATVFPNPASSNISISSDVYTMVEVYNVVGVLIDEYVIENKEFSVTNLPEGIYMMRFFGESESFIQKVVIDR